MGLSLLGVWLWEGEVEGKMHSVLKSLGMSWFDCLNVLLVLLGQSCECIVLSLLGVGQFSLGLEMCIGRSL